MAKTSGSVIAQKPVVNFDTLQKLGMVHWSVCCFPSDCIIC